MSSEIVFLVLAWLGTYVLHSTLLLGGVWILSRRGLLSAPRLAERVWRMAILGGILTAALQVGLGAKPILGSLSLQAAAERRLDDPPEEELFAPAFVPRPALEPQTVVPLGTPATFSPSGDGPNATRGAVLRARELRAESRRDSAGRRRDDPSWSASGAEAGFATTANTPREGTLAAAVRGGVAEVSWRSLVLATWVLFGGLGILGFLFAWSRLAVRLSDRREILAGPLRERLTELAAAAGLRRTVRLYASSTLASPITYGWLRRRVCIPVRALTDLTPGQQESMLAHEIAHAKRRDPLWFCLYTLAERVLFFQPLNRLARRELHDIAEMLCDDWAVRWTGGRLALASCLTEIAQWIVGRRHVHHPALPSPGMAGRPSRLGVRVERLLDDRRSPQPEPTHAWWSPVATTSLSLVAFAAPGVSSTPSAEETASDSQAVWSEAAELAPVEHEPSLLGVECERLDAEIDELQELLALTRAEIERGGLGDRYRVALDALERTIETLHQRRELLEEKLGELVSKPR